MQSQTHKLPGLLFYYAGSACGVHKYLDIQALLVPPKYTIHPLSMLLVKNVLASIGTNNYYKHAYFFNYIGFYWAKRSNRSTRTWWTRCKHYCYCVQPLITHVCGFCSKQFLLHGNILSKLVQGIFCLRQNSAVLNAGRRYIAIHRCSLLPVFTNP